jgi:YVTN family beta-propeller protein
MPAPLRPVTAGRPGLALAGLAGLAVLAAACSSPASTATARGGELAWVANYAYDSQPGDTVTPVDTAEGAAQPTVTTGSEPSALAPDGGSLLVTNKGANTMSVVAVASRQVTSTVRVGLQPDGVAVAPGGTGGRGLAVVANFGASTVSVVDLGTGRTTATVVVGNEPVAVAVDTGAPTTDAVGTVQAPLALVACFGSGTVVPINLRTDQAMPAITVGNEPDAVGVVPGAGAASAGHALVANFGSTTVSPIDLSTLQAGQPITVGGNPTGIAVTGSTAWVSGGASLTPIDGSTLTAGMPVAMPNVAEAVAIADGGSTAWVALQDGELVPVILADHHVGRPVTVGGRPSAVAVTAAAGTS